MDHIKDLLEEFVKKTNLINKAQVGQSVDFFNDILKNRYSILKDTKAYKLMDSVLYIECDALQIMQEVGIIKSQLMKEINGFLKDSFIKDLRLTLKSTT